MNTIDADGHIVEKNADLLRYLPEPYSKRTGAPTAWTRTWAVYWADWKATTFPNA